MKKLNEVIQEVTAFPEIYIGRPSLERFYAFVAGYLFQNEEANDHCLDGFTNFVSQKYGISSDHNWSSIIQFFSNGEEDAFNLFIKLFAEYRQQTR